MKSKRIELQVECPSCGGTGLYSGMAESEGVAVICHNCKGTGEYSYTYSYTPFTGRKEAKNIKRVFKKGTQYKIGLGVINYKGIGTINMDKEGVSYQEFCAGVMPKHIKQLGCPMLADQGACHSIKGFVETCNSLNGGWIGYIPECKHRKNQSACWERFEEETP